MERIYWPRLVGATVALAIGSTIFASFYGRANQKMIPVTYGSGFREQPDREEQAVTLNANSHAVADTVDCGGVERPLWFDDKNDKRSVPGQYGKLVVRCELANDFDHLTPTEFKFSHTKE